MAKYVISPDEEKTLDHWRYHAPKDDQAGRYEAINGSTRACAELILQACPVSRERSLAITKLEEARMWANAAIAKNE